MSKIPMILYKVLLNNKDSILSSLESLEKPSVSNYLLNITDAELSNKSYQDKLLIDVTAINFPDGLVPFDVLEKGVVTKEVYKDEKGEYFILFDNEKYYIQSSSPDSHFNSIKEIFRFHVNPVRVTPVYKKIFNEIRTRGGWEIQHWGNMLDEIRVECITGGLNKLSNGEPLSKNDSIVNSYAWEQVMKLKTIYDQDFKERNVKSKTLLGLVYYDTFYIGFFTDFTGPVADAEKPYIMTFSFGFKSIETLHFNTQSLLRISE